MNNYYKLLGVDRAESRQGIHTAYRRLAKQCHPDLVGEDSKEKFQGIQEAYEVLSDPDKRKHYDASIDTGPRREKSHIEPEPLVSSPFRSRVTYPEPLVRNFSPIDDFSSSCSSEGEFRNGTHSNFADVSPFCHGFEVTQVETATFLMSVFRWYRTERF